MAESIMQARKRVRELVKNKSTVQQKLNNKRIKPISIIVASILALIFATFLYFNNSGAYFSDYGALMIGILVLGLFFTYGVYSIDKKPFTATPHYSDTELVSLIRSTVGDIPQIKVLSDKEINAVFAPLHEYMNKQSMGERYFDEEEYSQFLKERGMDIDKEVVGLLFDVQELYLSHAGTQPF